MSSNDDTKGVEKARLKCAMCGMPVHRLFASKVFDESSGRFVDEYWCMKCFWDKGEAARKQQEKGR
jgi:hypothetical protein